MIRVFSVPRAIQQRDGNLHLRCQIHSHYRRVFHRPTEAVIPQGFERDAAATIRCEPSVLINDNDAVVGHPVFLESLCGRLIGVRWAARNDGNLVAGSAPLLQAVDRSGDWRDA